MASKFRLISHISPNERHYWPFRDWLHQSSRIVTRTINRGNRMQHRVTINSSRFFLGSGSSDCRDTVYYRSNDPREFFRIYARTRVHFPVWRGAIFKIPATIFGPPSRRLMSPSSRQKVFPACEHLLLENRPLAWARNPIRLKDSAAACLPRIAF